MLLILFIWVAFQSKRTTQSIFYRLNELAVQSSYLIWGNKVVIPFKLREMMLTELDENYSRIIRMMKDLACFYAWWPNIDSESGMTVKSYKSCQINQTMAAKGPIHPWKKNNSSLDENSCWFC